MIMNAASTLRHYSGYYPVKKSNLMSQNYWNFRNNQRTFDNIIMRKDIMKNELDIVFFDWTGGKNKNQQNNI